MAQALPVDLAQNIEGFLRSKKAALNTRNLNEASAILARGDVLTPDTELPGLDLLGEGRGASGRSVGQGASRGATSGRGAIARPRDVASADVATLNRSLPRTAAPAAPVQQNAHAAPAAKAAGPNAAPVATNAQTAPATVAAPTTAVSGTPGQGEGGKPQVIATPERPAPTPEQPTPSVKLTGVGMNGEAPIFDEIGEQIARQAIAEGTEPRREGYTPYNPSKEERDAGAWDAAQQTRAYGTTPQEELARLEAIDPPIQGTIGPFDVLAGGAGGLARLAQRGGTALVGAITRQLRGPETYGPTIPPGTPNPIPPGARPQPQGPGATTAKPRYSVTAGSRPSNPPSVASPPVAPTPGTTVGAPVPGQPVQIPIRTPAARNEVVPVGNAGPTASLRPSNPRPVQVQMPPPGGPTPGPVQLANPSIGTAGGPPVAAGIPPNTTTAEALLRQLAEQGPRANALPGRPGSYPVGVPAGRGGPTMPPAAQPGGPPLPPAGMPPRSGPQGLPAAPNQTVAPTTPNHIPQPPPAATPAARPELGLPTAAPNPAPLVAPAGNVNPAQVAAGARAALPPAAPTIESRLEAMLSGSRTPPPAAPPTAPQVFRPQGGATPTPPAPTPPQAPMQPIARNVVEPPPPVATPKQEPIPGAWENNLVPAARALVRGKQAKDKGGRSDKPRDESTAERIADKATGAKPAKAERVPSTDPTKYQVGDPNPGPAIAHWEAKLADAVSTKNEPLVGMIRDHIRLIKDMAPGAPRPPAPAGGLRDTLRRINEPTTAESVADMAKRASSVRTPRTKKGS